MKILPVLLVFTALPAFAQTPAASPTPPSTGDSAQAAKKTRMARATPPPRTAQPSATPLPVRRAVRVTPENEKKPGFFARIFSGRPKQAATPAPTATPKPAVAATRKKAPSASTTPSSNEVVATDSANPALPETTQPSRSVLVPRVSKPSTSVKVTPPLAQEAEEAEEKPKQKPEEAPATTAIIPRGVTTDPAPGDETPYQRARREAARDPQIAALGEKLNTAEPGNAYKAAAREYAAALFAKMREIDPAQVEWFTRMEGATIRRIDSGKPFVAE